MRRADLAIGVGPLALSPEAHCNGRREEMEDIVARTGPLTEAAQRRFQAGRDALRRHHAPAGKTGLADAAKKLAALLPAWG